MKNSLIYLLFLLYFSTTFPQDNRVLIYGKISTDSTASQNIHIINKNIRKGTTSNTSGEFEMLVKINDTLVFSSIQLKSKEFIITSKEIKSKKLLIILQAQINELDEITLKQHDLSGYLKNDSKNASMENYVNEFTLDLPNSGKAPVTEVDFVNKKINFYKRGGTITKIYGAISGENKKLKKLKKLVTEKMTLDDIRKLITDEYFTQTLNIKKDDIPIFIEYCKPKGIINLYKENKRLEIITILIKESKHFKRK